MFRNHWFRTFLLLLLSMLAPTYSRARSDLLQVPSLRFSHYLSVHLRVEKWSAYTLVTPSWAGPGLIHKVPGIELAPMQAYLIGTYIKWVEGLEVLLSPSSICMPLEARSDVSQVVLWWESDKGLCGGRENAQHLKPHSEAPPPFGEPVLLPFTQRCTRAAGLSN